MRHFIRYELLGRPAGGPHPEKEAASLGMKVIEYKGYPVVDMVVMEVDHIPEILPSHIHETDGFPGPRHPNP